MKRIDHVPVFGERVAGHRYVVRPSAYAVIENEAGDFAIVATRVGRFLIGGGIDGGETPEQAIAREALEECGLLIEPGRTLAEAIQLVYSRRENLYFEKPSVFLHACVSGINTPQADNDHKLLWVPRAAAADSMTHASHAWILRCAAQQSRLWAH